MFSYRDLAYGKEIFDEHCGQIGQQQLFSKRYNAPMYSISLPMRNTYARPLLPARAVLPQRWENALGSIGGSNWTTTSTCGKSSPLAATSVARSIDGEVEDARDDEKAESARVRAAGIKWPCREKSFELGTRTFGRT